MEDIKEVIRKLEKAEKEIQKTRSIMADVIATFDTIGNSRFASLASNPLEYLSMAEMQISSLNDKTKNFYENEL